MFGSSLHNNVRVLRATNKSVEREYIGTAVEGQWSINTRDWFLVAINYKYHLYPGRLPGTPTCGKKYTFFLPNEFDILYSIMKVYSKSTVCGEGIKSSVRSQIFSDEIHYIHQLVSIPLSHHAVFIQFILIIKC